jgi:hypothetical protein
MDYQLELCSGESSQRQISGSVEGKRNVPAQLWALLNLPLASNIAINAVINACGYGFRHHLNSKCQSHLKPVEDYCPLPLVTFSSATLIQLVVPMLDNPTHLPLSSPTSDGECTLGTNSAGVSILTV